jgi:hypothetical protein
MPKPPPIPASSSLNTETVALILGITRRRVDQIVSEGSLSRAKAGLITTESLAEYVATQSAGGTELEGERVLLVRAQRKLVDQRRRRAAGELLDAKLAHAFAAELVITTRNAFMNCGSVLAPLCARAADQHEIRRLIDTELREICEQLARKAEEPIEETDAPATEDDDLTDADETT